MTDPATSTATLHLLTGPWAAGKTTLVPHLGRLLPHLVVFDWDVLLPGLSAAAGRDARQDPSTWDGLRAMWVAVVGPVLGGGRDVLLCGPATPRGFAEDGLAPYPIRCAYLDCSDEVLAQRLRARGATEAEIADEFAMLAGLRESDCHRVHADDRAPREIAGDIAAWCARARIWPGRPDPVAGAAHELGAAAYAIRAAPSAPAGSSAGGSAVGCPRRFASSSWTTSGSETTSAGRSSTAERRPPVRGRPTNRCS